ncbi:hypothetical protein HPB52_009319 [Rhipicephalus sanguineus]|uniref:Tick transposon n=1 Tax=Rhipicephalus sanguineus TaxID=34632 RepID=A0A9D4PZ82_RHISA|nr:hypothetical protein HPB52_009319 [Rhipicephalus sanguineus]
MSRNRKPLTLGEKLRVIEEAEKRTGSTKASIARDLNIPESSLKTILAKKDSILLNASKFGLNRKAAKDGKYAAMEKALMLAGVEVCRPGHQKLQNFTKFPKSGGEFHQMATLLPALVIGKFEKPRCFKNLKRLPCQYTFNRKAWMTAAKFAAYLQQLDSRMGAKDRKILLLLDNAPCHPTDTSHLRNVKVAFLPPNCTSQLQPLDAGVIKCMKQKYRKFLVQRRLAGMERKQMATKLSVLDAMHYIASAWDAVTQETIANFFRHCGFTRSGGCFSEAAVLDDDEPEFGHLELPGSFADYVGADDDVAVCSAVSLDDIIETVRPDSAETSDEEEMDDTAEASASVPTYTDVLDYVDNIRRSATCCKMSQLSKGN